MTQFCFHRSKPKIHIQPSFSRCIKQYQSVASTMQCHACSSTFSSPRGGASYPGGRRSRSRQAAWRRGSTRHPLRLPQSDQADMDVLTVPLLSELRRSIMRRQRHVFTAIGVPLALAAFTLPGMGVDTVYAQAEGWGRPRRRWRSPFEMGAMGMRPWGPRCRHKTR